MQKTLWCLLVAAFSLGLAVDLSERWRGFLAGCGLLISLLGAFFASPTQTPAQVRIGAAADQRAQEATRPGSRVADDALHATVVRDSFERLSPTEAAALAGVLHHYRILRADRPRWVRPLELNAALELAATAGRCPRHRLWRLYYDCWADLRTGVGRRLRVRLEQHELVELLASVRDIDIA